MPARGGKVPAGKGEPLGSIADSRTSHATGCAVIEAKKILVPVNGESTDPTAIGVACQIARRSKGQVYAIHVIEVRRTLPLDADLSEEKQRADAILDRAERQADDLGQAIDTEILQARDIGTAIVDEAAEANADLIVLGVPYRRKFGEFDLGKTVPHVLKHAACEVWVCREPMAGATNRPP